MAFQPSKGKRHRKAADTGVSLTSLMDAMTIILLFLLNQFAADGALVTEAEGLKLPESLNLDKPKKKTTIIATTQQLVVDDEFIADASEFMGPVSPTSGFMIQKLYDHLDARAQEQIDLGDGPDGQPIFSGEIYIQGDRAMDYTSFLKVVYTASQAGFVKIKLITVEGD
jgi:biopolymer transport protein ExbD